MRFRFVLLALCAGMVLGMNSMAGASSTLSMTRTTPITGFYVPGQALDITVTLGLAGGGSTTSVGVAETVPHGWTFDSIVSANTADNKPTILPPSGWTGELDFSWYPLPTMPVVFTYRVMVPADFSGSASISGQAYCHILNTGLVSSDVVSTDLDEQGKTISGTVTFNGSGLVGVTMTGLPGSPSTNAQGAYTATVSTGWSGTATPTLSGYSFSPVSQTYTNVTSDQTQNYTATQVAMFTISGSVKLSGTGLADVIMNGLPGNPATNSQGAYTATVSSGWSGTVTPTLSGYSFTPASQAYTNVTSSQTLDYTASQLTLTISGSVKLDGTGLANVVMLGLPGNPATNAQGAYNATIPNGWSGTVTPTLADYGFTPASQTYANVIGNQTQDYTVACKTVSVPAGVQASDGTFTDKVRLTWSAVDGAEAYEVFRADSDDSGAATLLGQTSVAQYDDATAAAPEKTGGCKPTTTDHDYYYWVKAGSSCGESGFSASDNGYRGAAPSKVVEKVLPNLVSSDGRLAAQPDAVLSIRIMGEDEPVDESSVWGECDSPEGGEIQWLSMGNASVSDGWVLCKPLKAWTDGTLVTLKAGAKTVSGKEIGPFTYDFVIEASAEKQTLAEVPQPTVHDLAANGIESPAAVPETQILQISDPSVEAEPPDNAIGGPLMLAPAGVFDAPQWVWLPLPSGVSADRIGVLYYCSGDGTPRWFPADNVTGWMVPGSIAILRSGSTTYFGFQVRYGATIQLVSQGMEGPPAAASIIPVGNRLGDFLVTAFLALILLCGSRRSIQH